MKRAVGIKRAEKLVQAAHNSIGLTEGVTAAKMELKDLLEQYVLFTKQQGQIMKQVEELLNQIPGTEEMLTVPGVGLLP